MQFILVSSVILIVHDLHVNKAKTSTTATVELLEFSTMIFVDNFYTYYLPGNVAKFENNHYQYQEY